MSENPYEPPESDLGNADASQPAPRRSAPAIVFVGRISNFLWLASCAWLLPKMPSLLADPLFLLVSAAAVTALVFGIVNQRSKLRQRVQAVAFVLYSIRAVQVAIVQFRFQETLDPRFLWLGSVLVALLLLVAAWRILFGRPAREYFR